MTQTPDAERVWLYKSFFFLPLRLKQGSFKDIRKGGKAKLVGSWFVNATPEIQIGRPDTYAEYVYFHPHARKLLFVPQSQSGAKRAGALDALYVYHLTEDRKRDLFVEIGLPRYEDPKASVRLRVEDVTVMVYDIDVAILSLEVVWDSTTVAKDSPTRLTMADVFDVDNLLRRRGPSFVGIEDAKSFQADQKFRPKSGWASSQMGANELPRFVRFVDAKGTVVGEERSSVASEDFGAFFDESGTHSPREKSGSRGAGDLQSSDGFVGRHYAFWIDRFRGDLGRCEKFDVEGPIFDERGFFWSYVYVNSQLTKFHPIGGEGKSRNFGVDNPFGELTGETDSYREFLYRLVFADPANRKYEENAVIRDHLLESSLYLRFRDAGTVFGFCRYGGVMLLQDENGESWFARTMLRRHFETMYFQMANLLVTLRAGLLRFSERGAEITQKIHDRQIDDPALSREIEDLRQDFLLFHNKYWFCEITSQEQGIEMFDLWNRNMGNIRLFEEVDQEIKALHEFSLSKINNRLGQIAYLNMSAVAVAVLSVFAAGLSLSLDLNPSMMWRSGLHFGLVGLVLAIAGFLFGTLLLGALDTCKRWIDLPVGKIRELVGRRCG